MFWLSLRIGVNEGSILETIEKVVDHFRSHETAMETIGTDIKNENYLQVRKYSK
jgi:4-hydroxy-3-methylbut-2-en-1-yl diphosphate synthase IspG/GcpE